MASEEAYSSLTCDLPGDIMLEILHLQPVRTLLKFKCVNKSWYSLITNSSFIKMHCDYWSKHEDRLTLLAHNTESSEIGILYNLEKSFRWEPIGVHELDKLKVLGVSEGLVCLTPMNRLRYGYEFLVINPALRKHKFTYRKLVCESKREISDDFLCIGFGFDQKHHDFKIVRVEQLKENLGVRVNVYSLYAELWKRIKCPMNIRLCCPMAIYSCNSLYWLSNIGRDITVFELSSNRFYNIPLPGSTRSCCWRIQPYIDDSIGATIYEPADKSYCIWLVSPRKNLGNHCIWRQFKSISPQQRERERTVIRRLLTDKQRYKNLTPIWSYNESLVPVKRADHFFSNVVCRLKDAFWIRSIEDDSEENSYNLPPLEVCTISMLLREL